MRETRHGSKRGKNNFFMYLRLFVCVAIIATAVFLKETNHPVIKVISEEISKELKVSEAIEAISAKTKEEHTTEVFEEKEYIDQKFYIGEKEEELSIERRRVEEEEKKLSVETLSFQMSDSELFDDTTAEPFRIPPPSYCSYKKEEIPFKYEAPLYGVITSRFGYRDHPVIEDASFHTGLDIAAPKGNAVLAFAKGTVKEAGKNATYGNYILIEHSNGIKSFYGHNSKLNVKKGQSVSLGQKIAEVGSTGMSTGPHLHFEVRKNNIRLDPSLYISPERV